MKLKNVSLQKKEEISQILESRYFLSTDEKKLDRIISNAKLKSIIIIIQPLKDRLRFNNDFSWLERKILCSEIEEAARRYWIDKGMCYTEKKDKMEKALRKKLGKEFDENPSRYIDEIIENITKKEIYPIVRKHLVEEYKALYGRWWKVKIKGIERDRVEYYWHRRYDNLPYPLNIYWDYRNDWMQIYIASKNEKNFHGRGSPASSGNRQCHGMFGHKFAEINAKKNIPTEIFVYTKHNRFKLCDSFKRLVLVPYDLVGNYHPEKPIVEKNLRYCRFGGGFLDKSFWIKISKKKW
jgi:hypothetical protein